MTKIYQRYDSLIRGTPCKTIIEINPHTGEILQYMDRPKLGEANPTTHVSGCHLITRNPNQNHYDHFCSGAKWKEYKRDDPKMQFPVIISDVCVTV